MSIPVVPKGRRGSSIGLRSASCALTADEVPSVEAVASALGLKERSPIGAACVVVGHCR